jgi:hypothetical protein
MLIDIKAYTLSQDKSKKENKHRDFLESIEFKVFVFLLFTFFSPTMHTNSPHIQKTLTDKLLACLLSPHLTAYVTDLLHHVLVSTSRHVFLL